MLHPSEPIRISSTSTKLVVLVVPPGCGVEGWLVVVEDGLDGGLEEWDEVVGLVGLVGLVELVELVELLELPDV